MRCHILAASRYVRVRYTIQVRYNAVRRQTAAKAGEKELQVLDYQNTNAELMPLVAAAYALIFMVCPHSMHLCWTYTTAADVGPTTPLYQ